jgi:AcrR family transcriptional regulator
MGTVERREREREEIRTRILDAARRLFAAEGFDSVSMRKIADAIEYSPTAIYAHFQDKESLVEEMCRRDFEALAGNFAQFAGMADPVERIRAVGRAYVMFAVERPQHFRFMFMTPNHPKSNWPKPAKLKNENHGKPDKDAYAFLRNSVREALETGRFLPSLTDVELLTQTLWAAVHGLAALRVAKSDDAWVAWRPLPDLLDLCLDSSLRGLLSAGDPMLAKLSTAPPKNKRAGSQSAAKPASGKSSPRKGASR